MLNSKLLLPPSIDKIPNQSGKIKDAGQCITKININSFQLAESEICLYCRLIFSSLSELHAGK